MSELTSAIIAGCVALVITVLGIFVNIKAGGNWERFWKRQWKTDEERAEKASSTEHRSFAWNFLYYGIGGLYGFAILFSIVYVIIRGVVGAETRSDGSVTNSFFSEIPVLVCFGILGSAIVVAVGHYVYKRSTAGAGRIKRENVATATGTVTRVEVISTSSSQIGNNFSNTENQKIHIRVDSLGTTVTASNKVRTGHKTRGIEYRKGDTVIVEYDARRGSPTRANIVGTGDGQSRSEAGDFVN